MRTVPRCKRCGEQIHFLPKLSVIGHGTGFMPVNADDLKPHWVRCRVNRELAEAKRPVSAKPAEPEPEKLDPAQQEMFA